MEMIVVQALGLKFSERKFAISQKASIAYVAGVWRSLRQICGVKNNVFVLSSLSAKEHQQSS